VKLQGALSDQPLIEGDWAAASMQGRVGGRVWGVNCLDGSISPVSATTTVIRGE